MNGLLHDNPEYENPLTSDIDNPLQAVTIEDCSEYAPKDRCYSECRPIAGLIDFTVPTPSYQTMFDALQKWLAIPDYSTAAYYITYMLLEMVKLDMPCTLLSSRVREVFTAARDAEMPVNLLNAAFSRAVCQQEQRLEEQEKAFEEALVKINALLCLGGQYD